jgi:hypothetical protein
MILFHGGCHDCTQQDKHGLNFCFDCSYFNADWNKPSLNNKPPSEADNARLSVVASRRSRAEAQSTTAAKRENVAARQTATATTPSHGFRPGELLTVVAPDRRWWRRAWFRLLRRGEPNQVFQCQITKATANTLATITIDKP